MVVRYSRPGTVSKKRKINIIFHLYGAVSVLKPEKIGMMILFPQHVFQPHTRVLYDISGVPGEGGIPGSPRWN